MKYAAFDIEIAKQIPDGASDWSQFFPLGITCAAVALEDKTDEPLVWQGSPQLTQSETQAIVRRLQQLVNDGYTLLTWNGCNFDFRVLAEESGMLDACAKLAADHIDMMQMFTFKAGHYLGLDKALKGAGIQGKRKQVVLSTGEMIRDMDGAMAPKLWADGEYDAVLLYLLDDVLQPLKLARKIEESGMVRWTSGKGSMHYVPFERLYTVRESFEFEMPDTSWMSRPPVRAKFIDWMPGAKLPDKED